MERLRTDYRQISRTVHSAESQLGVDRRDAPEAVHAAVAEAIREWAQATDNLLAVKIELTDKTETDGDRDREQRLAVRGARQLGESQAT